MIGKKIDELIEKINSMNEIHFALGYFFFLLFILTIIDVVGGITMNSLHGKFTPGPYEVRYNDITEKWEVWREKEVDKLFCICECYLEANAYLIAATPEMYEALRKAEKALDALSPGLPDFGMVVGLRQRVVLLTTFVEAYRATQAACDFADGQKRI